MRLIFFLIYVSNRDHPSVGCGAVGFCTFHIVFKIFFMGVGGHGEEERTGCMQSVEDL